MNNPLAFWGWIGAAIAIGVIAIAVCSRLA